MGQQSSQLSEQPRSPTNHSKTLPQASSDQLSSPPRLSTSDLLLKFHKHCLSQLSSIEKSTLSQNVKSFISESEYNPENIQSQTFDALMGLELNYKEFLRFIGISSYIEKDEKLEKLGLLLFKFVSKLRCFPLNDTFQATVTVREVISVLVLVHPEKGSAVRAGVDLESIFYKGLAEQSTLGKESTSGSEEKHQLGSSHEDTHEVSYDHRGIIQWSELISKVKPEEPTSSFISTADLLNIIALILLLHQYNPVTTNFSTAPVLSKGFSEFSHHKMTALSLVKSMSLEITNDNFKDFKLTETDFETTIRTCAPFLLNSEAGLGLGKLLDSLLYSHAQPDRYQDDLNGQTEEHQHPALIAQLSSMLPPTTQWYSSSLHQLYSASKHGYSQRAFESKVLNYTSPTILYLKGPRIMNTDSATQAQSQAYKSFSARYPLFHDEPLPNQTNSDTISYAIYVDQPWRVSNKVGFGSKNVTILQLSPQQRIFHVNDPTCEDLVWFNNQGISFGSALKATSSMVNNVSRGSLLISPTLTHAIFHHLGPSKPYRCLDPRLTYVSYEDRFAIKQFQMIGCGGNKEILEQAKKWEWEKKESERRRYLNKDSFNEDRALLEMAGLVGGYSPNGGSAA
ncbi:hypothetical protein WICPIJ_000994 [Wickerhamomyces pijperi]|uniref:TLDc domain-containing protein n=1 Tax=Wickerhamomyces pijperi TaxID=599730 RepID=A0A9P8QEN6_WICPI|nr:hypothetical protein WICPIJ_000994 [Wickerhamomyces pijperi]